MAEKDESITDKLKTVTSNVPNMLNTLAKDKANKVATDGTLIKEPDVTPTWNDSDVEAFISSLSEGQKKTFNKATPRERNRYLADYFGRANKGSYTPVMDEDEVNKWLSKLEADDREIWDSLDNATKAHIMTYSDLPGTSYERRQMLRLKSRDRAKVSQQLDKANKEAYKTQGQGVSGVDNVPLPTKPLTGGEMTPKQRHMSDYKGQGTNNIFELDNKGHSDKSGSDNGDKALPVNKLPAKSKYQLKSIFQAYADGDFGEPGSSDAKHTRNMLVIDSLGKFAGNLGKDFANLAAAYTGGAINNERDRSMWQEHEDAMRQGYTEANVAGIGNSRENRRARSELAGISAQELGNMIQRDRYGMAEKVKALINSGDVKIGTKEYRDLEDAYNIIVSGGTFNQSMLQQLFTSISAAIGF